MDNIIGLNGHENDTKVVGMMLNNEDFYNLKESLKILFAERTRFIKSQCIVDSIDQLDSTNELQKELCNKIKSIYIRQEIENGDYKFSDKDGNTINILGIDSEDAGDVLKLSSSEKSALKSNVKKQLSITSSKFMKKLKIITDDKIVKLLNTTNMDYLCFNNSKIDVFKYCNQFIENVGIYNKVYEKTNELLFSFVNFKYNSMNKHFLEHVKHLHDSAKETDLRARVFKLKTEHLILSINNKTFDALVILHKKMKEKEKETSSELCKLELKLTCYRNLKDTDFPAIVKQYIMLEKSVQHLEWTLEEINKTS